MNNLQEGIDYYFNESGLFVFTEKYHLERGYCCGHQCRHCPFSHKNVIPKNKLESVSLDSNEKAGD